MLVGVKGLFKARLGDTVLIPREGLYDAQVPYVTRKHVDFVLLSDEEKGTCASLVYEVYHIEDDGSLLVNVMGRSPDGVGLA